MKHCGACKIVKREPFTMHDRFCDGCVEDALKGQPESLHFLDRLGLAIDELETRARMPVPIIDHDRVLAADARRRAEASRQERIRNPWKFRHGTP